MRVIYIGKKHWVAALAVLTFVFAASGLLLVHSGRSMETAAEPHRSGTADGMQVSLAINVDWGNEYLPAILDALRAEDVHATFFLTGRWTDAYPELAREIADLGHEIGNHGYSHKSPNASSKDEVAEEIRTTEEAIFQATGITTTLYAPPSGETEDHVLKAAEELGYETVLWTVDTVDWQNPDADTVRERVMGKIESGGIILAHPTAATAEALPGILHDLKEAGFQPVTVSENLGLADEK